MNEPIGEHARKLERDNVVKWLCDEYLKSCRGNVYDAYRADAVRNAADAIERCNRLESGK